jgi:multidrug efflux pump subunit AcrA (membrane-fusion protein)
MTTSTSGPVAESAGEANGQHGPATLPGAPNGSANGSAIEKTNGNGAVTESVTAPTRVGAATAVAAPPSPAAEPVTQPVTQPAAQPHAPSPAAPARPAAGPAAAAARQPAAEPKKSKRGRLLFLFPILLIILGVGGWLGYRYWYDSTYFIDTDNASVTGDLVQVGSLNAGRIVATRVDIGKTVQAGQEIAVIAMPQDLGGGTQGAGPKMGVTGTTDTLVSVYSPLTGVVAARSGYVGGTVAAGQAIYSLIDPSQVWIKANIEESSAWRVALGQPVDVHVDALNQDFVGRVDAITPAAAATFSLLPSSNASGNFTKVTQYVPIKISVDSRGVVLPLGTSVEVKIHVREPSSQWPLPWQP